MTSLHSNKPWLALAAGVAVVATLPWLVSEFMASVLLSCLMYIALATSWSLFCGSTRYLSLATSAFFGVGAYTSAMLLGVLPWPLVILSGALIAIIVAVVMGAAAELIRHAVTFVEKQVSGTVGRVLTVVPSNETVYLTVLLIAAAAIATAIAIQRSRFGLALAGIGADEQRAQTLGVDTRLAKIAGFGITAAFAGAVGAAMAVRWTYIEPAAVFSPFIGFQTVLIALIGGATSIGGPILAAIVFSLLAETLRLQLPYGYMMVLGLLLILCVMYLPNGLATLWQRRKPAAEAHHG